MWTWKFEVRGMAKVKFYGPIWGLEFNRYICSLFLCGNRQLMAESKFHSWPWKLKVKGMAETNQNRLRYSEGESNPARNERNKKNDQKLLREENLWPAAAAGVATSPDEPVQKHKITSGIPGWLDHYFDVTERWNCIVIVQQYDIKCKMIVNTILWLFEFRYSITTNIPSHSSFCCIQCRASRT